MLLLLTPASGICISSSRGRCSAVVPGVLACAHMYMLHVYACMFVCMYVYRRACMYVYACACMCICICMHVYTFVYESVCIFVHRL